MTVKEIYITTRPYHESLRTLGQWERPSGINKYSSSPSLKYSSLLSGLARAAILSTDHRMALKFTSCHSRMSSSDTSPLRSPGCCTSCVACSVETLCDTYVSLGSCIARTRNKYTY